MVQTKQKGQGLVEFALILPFLLLALLGIIEAARIIWAYTTVQTAARETARYAITGKPYIIGNVTLCNRPEGEPGASAPWNCNEEQYVADRVLAIKAIASRRITSSLTYNEACVTTFDVLNNAPCTQEPGNYGIAIIGQEISPTLSLTTPVERSDYPGSQGLNIKVRVFYNVEMLDPIFDALSDAMLGRPDSYIQVSGELTMQNEGIEPALGNVPPPAIGSGSTISGTTSTGAGPNGELIWSVSGDHVRQNEELVVHLENHQNQGGPYDIYLGTTRICAAVNTSTQHNGDYNCLIDPAFPPGVYDLFSTKADQYPNRLATWAQKVTVDLNTVASIVIEDPASGEPRDFWANNSYLQVELVAHNSAQQPFNVYFNYGLPTQQAIALGVNANVTLPSWQVSVAGNPCPVGGTPCTISSRRASDNSFVASADLFISQPEIVIVGGGSVFAQGETIFILLKGHTPETKYDLQMSDGGGNTVYLGRTLQTTNSLGETTVPLPWTVYEPGVPGWPGGWPNGFFNITSHPAADPPSMTSATRIATKQIQIDTPTGPFITVDGGYTWPINSIITIKVHKHPPAGNPYYLKFGPFPVPVVGTSPPYPFDVSLLSQSAAQNYQIPPGAASGSPTNQTIASFRNADNQLIAQRDVTVIPVPLITVLEGDRALPDATITIRLTNHAPNSAYQIVYAGVTLLDTSGQPFTIQTNGSGQGQRTYSLLTLPPSSPAANPANYGTAYPLVSQQTIAPNAIIATTNLTIDSADLKVTQIQLPTNATINAGIPMTVTIQNTKPVTITRFFDVDMYADPSPLVPAYKQNQFNFPGDVKLWKAPIVAPYGQPGDTFSLTWPFSVTTYGTHTFYGYADTSNFIFNETNEANNVLSNTITIGCNYPFLTDGFSNLSAWAPAVRYNTTDTQNQAGYPTISGGRLQMRNDGEGNGGSNDNASNRGYVLLYQTQPVATEPGLDVRVQVFEAPTTANFANAGIEVRTDPNSAGSAKIDFGLIWDTTPSPDVHRIRMNYRTTSGVTGQPAGVGSLTVNTSNPVWLRLVRQPGSNIFTFYYAQQSPEPTNAQWTVYTTQTIAISSTVYVGLYNVSFVDGTNGRAEFDNFKVSNTSVCPAGQGAPPPPVPPGLTLCTDPLQNKSFESISAWVLAGSEFVAYGPGGHTGTRQLVAHSFNGNYRKPYFYQRFQLPATLLATTTLKLNFFYTLNNLGDGDDPNDKYYAVVATLPSLAATLISNPVEIANGDVPPDTSSAPPNTITGWMEKNLTLPIASGINLTDYAGQDLYLYVYNTSNTIGVGCDPPGCHASEFYFDDVNLGICTGEPEPTSATTKLTGDVVLHQLGSPPQKIAGVTVWAYAENGALYKTFTIQNGKFNFFDLPATPTGIKYFIYAEYHIVDPNDPTQIETLAANTTVILRTSHTVQTPLVTRLDLFPTN